MCIRDRFQAYLPGDPARIDALVARAARAGYETLVLTVDIPVSANRENNCLLYTSVLLARPGAVPVPHLFAHALGDAGGRDRVENPHEINIDLDARQAQHAIACLLYTSRCV